MTGGGGQDERQLKSWWWERPWPVRDKHVPYGRVGVKSIPPEKVFKETKNSDGSTRVRCNFYNGGSDGKKARPLFFPSVVLLCVVSPVSPS